MNKNFPFGLGWQPDLPDHRDKKFGRARAKAVALRTGVPSQAASITQPNRSHSVVTHEAWEASHASSRALDEQMKAASSLVGQRYRAALQHAFGNDDGSNPVVAPAPGTSAVKSDVPRKSPPPLPNRPLLFDTPPEPDKLPKRVDLRPFMSPVENQEQIGSCTAHAVVGLVEYLQIATRGEYVDGARLFLYKATRDLLQWKGDTGAYIRETIKAMRLFGVCPERYLPYVPARLDEEPSAFCYAYAANYKAVSYYRLAGLTEIKQSLAQGYPVAFGFTCFESLSQSRVSTSGVIPYPIPNERAVGGHAVLAVGYQDTGCGTEKSGCLIIRNSWGDWGDHGYGYLPYAYLPGNAAGTEPLADDFWTMARMEIPVLSDSQAAPFALGEGNPVDGDDYGAPVWMSNPAV